TRARAPRGRDYAEATARSDAGPIPSPTTTIRTRTARAARSSARTAHPTARRTRASGVPSRPRRARRAILHASDRGNRRARATPTLARSDARTPRSRPAPAWKELRDRAIPRLGFSQLLPPPRRERVVTPPGPAGSSRWLSGLPVRFDVALRFEPAQRGIH